MRNYTTIKDRSKIKPQEQPAWERNLQIAMENLSGLSYAKLAVKYEITVARVGQIVKAWRQLALEQLKKQEN